MIHHSCPVLPPAGSVDRSQPRVDFITSSTHTQTCAHTQKCTFALLCACTYVRTHAHTLEGSYHEAEMESPSRCRRKIEKSLVLTVCHVWWIQALSWRVLVFSLSTPCIFLNIFESIHLSSSPPLPPSLSGVSFSSK